MVEFCCIERVFSNDKKISEILNSENIFVIFMDRDAFVEFISEMSEWWISNLPNIRALHRIPHQWDLLSR